VGSAGVGRTENQRKARVMLAEEAVPEWQRPFYRFTVLPPPVRDDD